MHLANLVGVGCVNQSSTYLSYSVEPEKKTNEYVIMRMNREFIPPRTKTLAEVIGEKILLPFLNNIQSLAYSVLKFDPFVFPSTVAQNINTKGTDSKVNNLDEVDKLQGKEDGQDSEMAFSNGSEVSLREWLLAQRNLLIKEFIQGEIDAAQKKLAGARYFANYKVDDLKAIANAIIAESKQENINQKDVGQYDSVLISNIEDRFLERFGIPRGEYTGVLYTSTRSIKVKNREKELSDRVYGSLLNHSMDRNQENIRGLVKKIQELEGHLQNPSDYIPPKIKIPDPLTNINVEQLVADSESYSVQMNAPWNYFIQVKYIASKLCGEDFGYCFDIVYKCLSKAYKPSWDKCDSHHRHLIVELDNLIRGAKSWI